MGITPEQTNIEDGMAQKAEEECARYDALLEQLPRDIQLLGLGSNGHIAFNDRELLEKAFSAKNGDTVRRLYNGEDLRHNHFNSDMSLMNYLAFYSGGNVEQMTRIFATSGLYRPDKPASYYEYTAIKAAKDTPHYTPPRASSAAPKAVSSGSDKA